MLNLYKKEINYYLNNPVGDISIILFALFANFLFVKDIFVVESASMRPFFAFLPWLFMILIPALSMRILSEEKRMNTIEILLTLPISETQIVIAKFLALLTLTIIGLLLTIGLPISLSFITKIYYPEIIVAYGGVIALASALISLSMFFSVRTKNQVVAFLSSVIVIFLLMVMATDFLATVLPRFIEDYFSYLTPLYHYQNFIKGVIDIRSLFYFLSFCITFLFLTIIDLERRG